MKRKARNTFGSEYGENDIQIPRDRVGEHDPIIVKKHKKNVTFLQSCQEDDSPIKNH